VTGLQVRRLGEAIGVKHDDIARIENDPGLDELDGLAHAEQRSACLK